MSDRLLSDQAGFKADKSTIDAMQTLADIYIKKPKRFYCCFIDYHKAFYTINRTALWTKLLSSGKSERVLYVHVVKNLYGLQNHVWM